MKKEQIIQKIVAHRGMSGDFPENTEVAFAAAKSAGLKWIETDVSMLKDETLVIYHDKTQGRTTSGNESLNALTWPDFEDLDAGVWRGDEFKGQKVLRLEDCLSWVIANDMRVILEMKIYDKRQRTAAQAIWSRLAKIPKKYFVLSSFDLDFLGHCRAMGYSGQLASIHSNLPSNIDRVIRRLSLTAIHIDHRSLSSESEITLIKRSGSKVLSWTVNDSKRAIELFRMGVDMLISDFPDQLSQS